LLMPWRAKGPTTSQPSNALGIDKTCRAPKRAATISSHSSSLNQESTQLVLRPYRACRRTIGYPGRCPGLACHWAFGPQEPCR
jgi:hypothetical protein